MKRQTNALVLKNRFDRAMHRCTFLFDRLRLKTYQIVPKGCVDRSGRCNIRRKATASYFYGTGDKFRLESDKYAISSESIRSQEIKHLLMTRTNNNYNPEQILISFTNQIICNDVGTKFLI
ncbi:hypothetical protein VCUG_02197 [Vavraia culicis subsp. floridensis]|uniref:Uncharacterized protein n=1 Tax=Vavraia culicis (isolate floridensis) TaxID=948595 RepID=L2GRP8_VAVCU|nr:uncharacterized protein VCUG_02197 [Vavraia culicis subsp. floridensis]ELA46309.1 hypothetical protein VCUG_02197 [Vavraia culicis subsp. floridensis]